MSAIKEHYHDQIEAGQRATNLPLIAPFPKGDERKEHPILFSTPMVKAILEGRKTQTRRIVKAIPCLSETVENTGKYLQEDEYWRVKYCPYGQPGDLLWVREKFAKTMGQFEPEICYSFFADNWSWEPADTSNGKTACQWYDPDLSKEVKWKPSIHMPKEAARIWLEVEEVRVERLESISDEDAKDEGIDFVIDKITGFCGFDHLSGGYNLMTTPWHSFMSLWRKVHGIERYGKTGNPWVWVVKFKVLSTIGKPVLTTNYSLL